MALSKPQTFIRGAAILSAAGLISKFLGSFYRIILTRIIGAEGIGLFEMAYPIYVTLLTLSRSGIPVALGRLIAQQVAAGKLNDTISIFRTARFLSIIVGLFFSSLLLISSQWLINFLGWDPRVLPSIIAIAPAIFLVSIMAAYRGYFQGFQQMIPTGVSQVIEQAVRMISMIILVIVLLPKGLEYSAAGATFGAVTGAGGGLLVMLYFFKKNSYAKVKVLGWPNQEELRTKTKQIAKVAIPVTIGALVFPLMRLVDAVIIPGRLLTMGSTFAEATAQYGALGTALVLVNFPGILTVSLAASLVPSIAEITALGKRKELEERINIAFRLALIIGLPASLGLYVLALPLSKVIFGLPQAAIPLEIVSWGVLFIALQQTSSAILQGAGYVRRPAINLFFGALLNGGINFWLTAQPQWGIRGAALGTTLGFALAAVLNMFDVLRLIKPKMQWKLYLSILSSSLIMFFSLKFCWALIGERISSTGLVYVFALLLMVLWGMILFFMALFLVKGVRKRDIIALPLVGEKIAAKLIALRIIREK